MIWICCTVSLNLLHFNLALLNFKILNENWVKFYCKNHDMIWLIELTDILILIAFKMTFLLESFSESLSAITKPLPYCFKRLQNSFDRMKYKNTAQYVYMNRFGCRVFHKYLIHIRQESYVVNVSFGFSTFDSYIHWYIRLQCTDILLKYFLYSLRNVNIQYIIANFRVCINFPIFHFSSKHLIFKIFLHLLRNTKSHKTKPSSSWKKPFFCEPIVDNFFLVIYDCKRKSFWLSAKWDYDFSSGKINKKEFLIHIYYPH